MEVNAENSLTGYLHNISPVKKGNEMQIETKGAYLKPVPLCSMHSCPWFVSKLVPSSYHFRIIVNLKKCTSLDLSLKTISQLS